jgi:hypothetical protein
MTMPTVRLVPRGITVTFADGSTVTVRHDGRRLSEDSHGYHQRYTVQVRDWTGDVIAEPVVYSTVGAPVDLHAALSLWVGFAINDAERFPHVHAALVVDRWANLHESELKALDEQLRECAVA